MTEHPLLHRDPVADAALRLAQAQHRLELAIIDGQPTTDLWRVLYDLHEALTRTIARGGLTDTEERARLRAAVRGSGEVYRGVDEITDAALAAGFTYRVEFDEAHTA